MWISIKNALPIMEEPAVDSWATCRSYDVLISDGRNIFIGYHIYDDEFGGEWKLQGRDYYSIPKVTHWQSLPKAPDICPVE